MDELTLIGHILMLIILSCLTIGCLAAVVLFGIGCFWTFKQPEPDYSHARGPKIQMHGPDCYSMSVREVVKNGWIIDECLGCGVVRGVVGREEVTK